MPRRGDASFPQPDSVLDPLTFEPLRELLTPEVLTQIYREFLEQTRMRIDALLAERASVPELAHTMRGTAGMLGAQAIAALAGELEQAPADQDPRRLLGELHRGCDLLEQILRGERLQL